MPNEPPHARCRGRALYEEIKARILDGTYAAGTELPSTRACGAERGLSRTTVSAVYEQLASEGFIETHPGALSRVAAGAMAPKRASSQRIQTNGQPRRMNAGVRLSAIGARVAKVVLPPVESTLSGCIDFLYGPLAGGDFPTLAWLKAARQVERERPTRLAYDDPRGDAGLRRALQTYLARARGLSCDLEQVIIVNGSQQAVDLCARLLVDPPDHTKVRAALQKVLSPLVVKTWKDKFAARAEEIADEVVAKGCVDGVADISEAFVLDVFPSVLGVAVPPERIKLTGELNFNQIGPNNARTRIA